MAKIILSDREVGLIKGLIQHRALNDQQVLAIFSFLDRNFNHREIGAIRKGTKPRYVNIAAASIPGVDTLLYQYSKLAALAEQLGFYTTTYAEAQVRKAVEIFKTAVLVYNNNILSTRSETFIVLSIIAWTYLLHARLIGEGVTPVFKNADGTTVLVDGQEKLWELGYCIERLEANLSAGEKANLKYLIAIRNAIEHRSAEDINDALQAKIQANALNFLKYVKEKFGNKYDFSHDLAFAIQLQALTLQSANALKGTAPVAKAVAAVNALLEGPMTQAEFNDPAYSFRVYVVPKVVNNAKKADQAVIYSPVGSDVEVAIKLVERPKYRMREAIKKLLDDDGLTVSNHAFQQAWKLNDLKNPAKGLAIQLGGQWFWYQEGIDKIREIVTA
ncbi:DUF3644 domain-containing protein [Gluconacetobacter azotocaptans]|uniref:DUF3644 domain-containing protein n=1 Tax=Gluconacetobacter azotocaptans TaxID=142834 RepID=UPI00195E5C53|nr:DUF3644 domain-containing protein [Gluconacetobacter azotocaptans]MBM9402428.1 DUF3644 domain-containing protein [Gluconacetobacter azotocaptans]